MREGDCIELKVESLAFRFRGEGEGVMPSDDRLSEDWPSTDSLAIAFVGEEEGVGVISARP